MTDSCQSAGVLRQGQERTRWPPDLATPASRTGQADQTGHAGGCQKNLGPADRSIPRTARSASADSEVRPGPRPPTLRPNQSKTTEAGPEHLSTSSLPIRRANRCGSLRSSGHAEHPVLCCSCNVLRIGSTEFTESGRATVLTRSLAAQLVPK